MGKSRKPLKTTISGSVLDFDVLSLDVTQAAKALKEGLQKACVVRQACRKVTDPRYLSGLLRPRRERPSDGSAAKKRDELAPLHSITSSGATSILLYPRKMG